MTRTIQHFGWNRRTQRKQRKQSSLLSLRTPVQKSLLLSVALFCEVVQAQCYFDPFTGRQICTQPQDGWQPYSEAMRRLGPYSPPAEAGSPAAHCRITVGDGSAGSGTLVACDQAVGLVLTCSHLFDELSGRIVVTFPNGRQYAARLLERDRGHDLAALAIRRPEVTPLAVSDQEASGVLRACGFGSNGQFRCVEGGVTGRATAVGAEYPSLTIRGAVRSGDSGGGVLNAAGHLVGVVWGQRDGLTYATCGRPVREFLDRVLGNRVARKNTAGVGDDPARRPPIDWQAWTAETDARIRALDEKKQDKGEYLQAGDLDGYVRASDVPKFDDSQFARRSEVGGRLDALSAHFKSVRTRVDSFEQHLEKIAAGKPGFFQGLSFGKLVAGALGLSGPVAAAVIVAGGLAGRRVKKQGAWSREEGRTSLPAPCSTLPASKPIAVDSPPLPQRTVPETHYVPFEKDSFSKAHQWASEQVARKYPGATEVLQAQDSLIKQYLAAQ